MSRHEVAKYFFIMIKMHQQSESLAPCFFAVVINEMTQPIQNDIFWCMLFVNSILLDETRMELMLHWNDGPQTYVSDFCFDFSRSNAT